LHHKKKNPSRRNNREGTGFIKNLKRSLILLILIVAGAIFYEVYFDRPQEETRPPEITRSIPEHRGEKHRIEPGEIPLPVPERPVTEAPGTEKPVPPPTEKATPTTKAPKERVSGLRIAILIDDIGADLSPVKNLLKIEAPISFAVLPHMPRGAAAADMIHKAGRDVLLHLPMEPRSYPKEKPGPGALLTTMDDSELRKVLTGNLDAVPHISGVNNHMGSLFTEDEEKLAIVMAELEKRGLFFIDSRTTPYSKAAKVSQDIGIPFASRRIFIDNGQDYTKTCQILLDVLNKTKDGNSTLLLIGHPYPNTVSALAKIVPELKSRGVEVVSVSSMVR